MLSLNDYKSLIVQFLPRGAAWTGPRFLSLVQGLAVECHRVDEQAEILLSEALPQTTDQCLSDWERVLGLPDAAFPLAASVDQRRANVLAKLAAQGGQSRAYFIDVAGRMGYTVSSITDCYQPFASGRGYAGAPVYGVAWAFTFTVNVDELPGTETVTDLGPGPYPLRRFVNARLEAAFAALKPGHTVALFVYPA